MKTNVALNGRRAFTLLELMVVLSVIGLLAAIAFPNFIRSTNTSRLNSIQENLRVVSDAKEQWALANSQVTGAPTDMPTLNAYFLHGVTPVVQETYFPNPLGTPAYAQLPGAVTLPPFAPGAAIPAP